MESNKPKLLSIEEYEKSVDDICDSIMNNIVEYLSDDVYVEKDEKYFCIKSFSNNSKNSDKDFSIKINKTEFNFQLYQKTTGIGNTYFITSSNNVKEKPYDTGSFNVKPSLKIFNKYENWINSKYNEFMLKKMNSLQDSLYTFFKLDKTIKRKKVIKDIINKKEDLYVFFF